MSYYANQPSLAEAIRVSALCQMANGKRHPHQYRIPLRALQRARRALLRANLRAAATFEDLYDRVEDAILPIRGIGALTVYDVAQRLGAYLRLEPRRVYMHAGTRDGAKALGLDHRRIRLGLADLPAPLRRLPAFAIEDFLCIYKARFRSCQ